MRAAVEAIPEGGPNQQLTHTLMPSALDERVDPQLLREVHDGHSLQKWSELVSEDHRGWRLLLRLRVVVRVNDDEVERIVVIG